MKKHILTILFIILTFVGAKAQCNYRLVEKATSMAGKHAIFLRDFKIKFSEGTMENPSPVGKYSMMMNAGVNYRFTIANSSELPGKGIVQLYQKDQLKASTFNDETMTDKQLFDYKCEKTGSYQLFISFREGQQGCAVTVVSMLTYDSIEPVEPLIKIDRLDDVVYINIDNPIHFESPKYLNSIVEVYVDSAFITGSQGDYILHTEKTGLVNMDIFVKDSSGNILEKERKIFTSKILPLPYLTLNGTSGGIISEREVSLAAEVELESKIELGTMPFEIIEYTISRDPTGIDGITWPNAELSEQQKRFISSLSRGQTFYISNILVKGPNKKIEKLAPVGFIIE